MKTLENRVGKWLGAKGQGQNHSQNHARGQPGGDTTATTYRHLTLLFANGSKLELCTYHSHQKEFLLLLLLCCLLQSSRSEQPTGPDVIPKFPGSEAG